MAEREAQMGVVSGQRGCGKTYTTLKVQITNAINGIPNVMKPKRVLILDSNNEYGDVQKDHKNHNFPHIKALAVKDLQRWLKQPVVEARRISVMKPVEDGGGKMGQKELQEVLSEILKHFRNGLLIIEDLTSFVSDSLPADLIGKVATQRHVSVDIIIHFQTIGKVAHPKIWSMCNWYRFHKNGDTIEKNKNKLTGNLDALYIAEKMIHKQDRMGNKRFYVYYHRDTNSNLVGKIQGAFSQQMFKDAVEEFLAEDMTRVNKEINRVNLRSGAKIHKSRIEAIDFLISECFRQYYGNPDMKVEPKKIIRPERAQPQIEKETQQQQ